MLSSLTSLSASLADARAVRAQQKRLRDELSSFRTPTERAELAAVLGRCAPDARELLASQTGLRSVA